MRTLFLLSFLVVSAISAHEPIANATKSARLFLDSLDAEQRQTCQMKWSDQKRKKWNFLPDKFIKPERTRFGLRWDKMRADQQMLAHSLLTSALSAKGHRQAMTIVALEQVLHQMEKKNPIRDPKLFYVSIFGNPSDTGTWSWRFEGHHLSINVTIVDGKQVAVTPQFLGANPEKTSSEYLGGVEVMADEQHQARALVKSLNTDQLTKARFANKAPRDIITGSKQKVGRTDKDWFSTGITAAELNANQRTQLEALLKVYTSRFRPEWLAKLTDGAPILTDDVRFAWAGGLEPDQGHYYRIVSKRYLIEYDNVQNSANHVHATWRDFDGDFGEDLLKAHHEKHHND